MSKKTAVATPEPESEIGFFCPVCRESWDDPEDGHVWEFQPSEVGPDKLECPLAEATLIRVAKFGQ